MMNLTRADTTVVLLAAGGAAALWSVGRGAGIDLVVNSGDGTSHVNVVSVVVTSLVVAIAGAALLGLFERRTANARRTWTIVAVAVWMVSLPGPLSAGLVLLSLHVLVGGVVVLGLRRTHPADRTRVA